MPEIKDKKAAALAPLHKQEMGADLKRWSVPGFANDAQLSKKKVDEVRSAWKLTLKEQGMDDSEITEAWQNHLDARAK